MEMRKLMCLITDVTRELLTSFEYQATIIIITVILASTRRANSPRSIDGLHVCSRACWVSEFWWWKLRLSTGEFWEFWMSSGVWTRLWLKHVLPLSEQGNDVGHGIITLCASLSKLERQDVVFYLRKPLGKEDPIWLHEGSVFTWESRHSILKTFGRKIFILAQWKKGGIVV